MEEENVINTTSNNYISTLDYSNNYISTIDYSNYYSSPNVYLSKDLKDVLRKIIREEIENYFKSKRENTI